MLLSSKFLCLNDNITGSLYCQQATCYIVKQNSKIGDRIKNAREKARNGQGISQTELADLIGIKQASLSEIELSKSVPRRPTVIALSFVLGDDFGEDWLRDFFRSPVNQGDSKDFNHQNLAELFRKADALNEESISEMQHIWEMLKTEIDRRTK